LGLRTGWFGGRGRGVHRVLPFRRAVLGELGGTATAAGWGAIVRSGGNAVPCRHFWAAAAVSSLSARSRATEAAVWPSRLPHLRS